MSRNNVNPPAKAARQSPAFYRYAGSDQPLPNLETHLPQRFAYIFRTDAEIQLSPTLIGGSKDNPQFEENEAVLVYDKSPPQWRS